MSPLLPILLPVLPVLGLVAAVNDAPPAPTSSVLVPVLVALLSGAGSGWLAMWYRERKVGAQEREEIISRASKQVVEGAEVLLQQYREDLRESRKAIAALQAQLEEATRRISKLERELTEARGDRDRIAADLSNALEKRGILRGEVERLTKRVHDLEAIVGTGQE